VEKGKVADIVIVNGDVAKDITATMKGGKIFHGRQARRHVPSIRITKIRFRVRS
jgi:formylmethanofuran dehydrogenase subunit C